VRGCSRTTRRARTLPAIGVLLQEARDRAGGRPTLQIPWNARQSLFNSFTSRASARTVPRRSRTPPRRPGSSPPRDDRAVAELPTSSRRGPAGEQFLPLHLLVEVDEDAHGPEAARRARLDGHEELLQRLAGVMFSMRRRPWRPWPGLRPGQLHVGDHQPVHSVDRGVGREADTLDGFDSFIRCAAVTPCALASACIERPILSCARRTAPPRWSTPWPSPAPS